MKEHLEANLTRLKTMIAEQQPQPPPARDDLTSIPVRLSVSASKKKMLLLAGDLESDTDDFERDHPRERGSSVDLALTQGKIDLLEGKASKDDYN